MEPAREGNEWLWLGVLHRLEDVVGTPAATSLVRYATTEAVREALEDGGRLADSLDRLGAALGGSVRLVEESRDGLTVDVGIEVPPGAEEVAQAFVVGAVRGAYLSRFRTAPTRESIEPAQEGGYRVRVSREARTW